MKYIRIALALAFVGLMVFTVSLPFAPKAEAQVYSDSGVSNNPSGGFVFGFLVNTNNPPTNGVAVPVPLGFFGHHSTNKLTLTLGTANATTLSNLAAILQAYGLINTN